MSPRFRLGSATLVALLLVAPLLLVTSAQRTAAASVADLRITPGVYVGGQRLVFEGDLGVGGRRRIKLQLNLSRPGDEWKDVNGFRRRWTRADGSFRFGYRAPAMFGIRMRVASGGLHTPPVEFHARSQDLVLHTTTPLSGLGLNEVLVAQPFAIDVDTTPEGGSDLARRTDLPPPAFPGRDLTLQRRRVDGSWQDVATTVTDDQGNGRFAGLTVAQPGTLVYRVRQEDWTENGDRVGWYPSFPTYVDALPVLPSDRDRTVGSARTTAETTESTAEAAGASAGTNRLTGTPLSLGRDVASRTAAERYQWRPSLWDFGWTYGESLTDRPSRGTDRVGWWQDWADGTGRAAKHNGGLMLDSQRQNKDGYGASIGTTMATLQGNPMRYGRWEVRLRMKSTETAHRDLRAHVELVPEGTDPGCHAEGITIAAASPHVRGVEIGVRNAQGDSWKRTEPDVSVNGTSHAVAVEVTRKHVSWFLEGQLIGTVTARRAIPDQPMTLRVSLEGHGQEQVDRTQAIFDWMRGYSLDRGQRVGGGARLPRGTHDLPC